MPDELHIQLGDCWELIQQKLDAYERTMDARMKALMENLAELRARVTETERGLDHIERVVDRS